MQLYFNKRHIKNTIIIHHIANILHLRLNMYIK